MISDPGYTTLMGPLLRAEVERQLMVDLKHYGVVCDDGWIDWSGTCPEGHTTQYRDGQLENWSGVGVGDAAGTMIAGGWIDFIHGGDDNPLFVFWQFLDIHHPGGWTTMKSAPGIPPHVWEQIPESSRVLCRHSDRYDARWAADPLVVAWQQERHRYWIAERPIRVHIGGTIRTILLI